MKWSALPEWKRSSERVCLYAVFKYIVSSYSFVVVYSSSSNEEVHYLIALAKNRKVFETLLLMLAANLGTIMSD